MSVYTYLGPTILMSVVLLACLWLVLRGRTRAWFSRQTVRCPSDGGEAIVDVLTRPRQLDYLVTTTPSAKSTVCACSRFGDAPVTCEQECLKQKDW